jgi:aconitate hydratase
MLVAPVPPGQARDQELVKGPNVASLPDFDPLPDHLEVAVELKVGDDISTDEILPAGAEVLPLRSNIPAISAFVFRQIDAEYANRTAAAAGQHLVVAGENYGQGSSREHAVIAPRYLGLRVVIARSFARIHFQNLANFGILPLRFDDPAYYDDIERGDRLAFDGLRDQLAAGKHVTARHGGRDLRLVHDLSARQVAMVLAGGRIAHARQSGS